MQSANCRKVQGPLNRLALQGLLEHIQLALCQSEPLHGSDNLQNHHAITWALPKFCRHLKMTAGLSMRCHAWVELSTLQGKVRLQLLSKIFTRNRKNAGQPDSLYSLVWFLASKVLYRKILGHDNILMRMPAFSNLQQS